MKIILDLQILDFFCFEKRALARRVCAAKILTSFPAVESLRSRPSTIGHASAFCGNPLQYMMTNQLLGEVCLLIFEMFLDMSLLCLYSLVKSRGNKGSAEQILMADGGRLAFP